MEGYRRLLLLLVLSGLTATTGASCPQVVRQTTAPIPRALPPAATLEQVIQVVNDNASRIRSFSTTEATLASPGTPTLRASVMFERPRRFRLRGETGITGPEVDLGGNDELFWFWVRRNQPPALFYCRHDQFYGSAAREVIPFEPDWLIEALGVAGFDPGLAHRGPFRRHDGRLEIRTIRDMADGPTTRITVVDPASGCVLEQHVYNAQGNRVASAIAGNHRVDPLTALVMPGTVDIDFPPMQFSMRVDLGNVQINRPFTNPQELWAMPSYEGWPPVDLADPNLRLVPGSPPPKAISTRPGTSIPGWTSK